jgi:hypothetical protein
LSLGLGLEEIRREMYKVRNIALTFEEDIKKGKYFDGMNWLKCSLQDR